LQQVSDEWDNDKQRNCQRTNGYKAHDGWPLSAGELTSMDDWPYRIIDSLR
jgi:hypothetical protein